MITPEISIVKTQDYYNLRAFGRWSSSNYCPQLLVGFRIGDSALNPSKEASV